MADCGQLVSVEEAELDPGLVDIPAGQCTVSPQEVTPPQSVDLSATVVNDNEVGAEVNVEWTWQAQQLATDRISVGAGSQGTATATATIENTGRDQVSADVIGVSEITGFQPAAAGDERVRAGSPSENNSQHRTVADGGTERGARAAIARACGGCADRSRKMTETNRRLRDTFHILGG